jgi:hypothetical protein
MKDATRVTVWSILSEAFAKVLRAVQATVPEATMKSGRSHNEAFLFRAYAEYLAEGHVVDISFDVQMKDSQIHVFGDIASEDGIIVRSLMDTTINTDSADDELFIAQVRTFVLLCEQNVNAISDELHRVRKTP